MYDGISPKITMVKVIGLKLSHHVNVCCHTKYSLDKAWELFCRKAFQSEFKRCCPKELVKLSMDIVKKCKGLPLAIVAIGGLLST
jgi:hypothetical protein